MAANAIFPISFFKIILKTNLQRLQLPKKFTERYGGGLSNPVLLKPPDGTEWEVYWTRQNSEVWFQKGWKEFAQNYSLDHGHLVVFEYEGTSHFDVLILDQSALEIDYPSCDGEKDKLGHQSDADKSLETLEEWPYQKPKQKSLLHSSPPHKKMKGEKGVAQRNPLSMNWPRQARAQEVAETFVSKKNNPFLTVTIKPVHTAEGRLHITGLEGYVENVDKYVKLQIGEERSWNVKLYRHSSNGHYFSSGWSLFAMETELQPGDVCVFELINREDPIFEVHIFKRHS
ncbi:B3 domain-containing transcription factor VRN1-like [Lotus japonicus]|uniref:B3 domain-containing transcription factor VRN1-like n=1 Tax=Lotus japonicus TaxID=34305 RepID=UPI00258CFA38|nr:B3 domain-containing transcription factor VRN1-like [Lotus japonicus]XP_057426684.1 B3 domain-containing transcription factor VRN1-like [Lotus japonicus]